VVENPRKWHWHTATQISDSPDDNTSRALWYVGDDVMSAVSAPVTDFPTEIRACNMYCKRTLLRAFCFSVAHHAPWSISLTSVAWYITVWQIGVCRNRKSVWIWFFKNQTFRKFEICSDGFPTETAFNLQFKLKMTKK